MEPPNDLALPVNIRLGWKSLTVTNTKIFYDTKLITIEKSLMVIALSRTSESYPCSKILY